MVTIKPGTRHNNVDVRFGEIESTLILTSCTRCCHCPSVGVLEDFGHGLLHGRLSHEVNFVACYVAYQGRPQAPVPVGFGSLDDALLEWVFGIGRSGTPTVPGSVVDFFLRTLGITLHPVGGQRIWSVSVAQADHIVDGKLRPGGELRALVKKELAHTMAAAGYLLSVLDADGDHLIESPEKSPEGQMPSPEILVPPEVLLLALDNLFADGGQTGGTVPGDVDVGNGCLWTGRVSGLAAGAGVLSMEHELLHLYGTTDLYGAGRNRNLGFTTMSAIPADPNTRVRLDPWHEMQLGVTTPIVGDLTTPGSATIEHAGGDGNGRALLLADPARRFEGFLVQLRMGPQDPIDRDGPDGWCVWHVAVNASTHGMLTFPSWTQPGGLDASVNVLGAPDLDRGAGTAWPDDTTTPELRWWDGAETGVTLTFERAADRISGTVRWEAAPSSWKHSPSPLADFPVGAVPCASPPALTTDPASGWPLVGARTTADRMRLNMVLDQESLSPWSVPALVESSLSVALTRSGTNVAAAYLTPTGRVLVDYPPYFPTPSDCDATNVVGSLAIALHGNEVVVAWRTGDAIVIGVRGGGDRAWRHEQLSFADQFEVPLAGTSPALVTTLDGAAEGTCFAAWTGADALVRIRRRGTLGSWVDRFTLDDGITIPAVLTMSPGFATTSSPALATGPDGAVWVTVKMASRPASIAYGRAPAALGQLEPAPPAAGPVRKRPLWRPLRREVELGPMLATPSMTGDPSALTIAWLPQIGSPVRLGRLGTPPI